MIAIALVKPVKKNCPQTTANIDLTDTDNEKNKNNTSVYGGKFLYAPLTIILQRIIWKNGGRMSASNAA